MRIQSLILALLLIVAFSSNAISGKIETTIYGKAHVSIENLSDGDESSIYVLSNTSRIGFKGSVKLDHGLKVFWQIENHVNFDETGKDFASRSTFAGIVGSFGNIYFGRDDTPFKIINRKIDLFVDRLGDTRNIAGVGGYGFNLRANNAVGYNTPDFDGIQGAVLYVPEEGIEDNSLISANVLYNKSGIFAGASFEQHGKMLTPDIIKSVVTDEDSLISASDESEYGLRLATGYTRSKFRLVGSFEILSNINGFRDVKRNTFGFGGCFKASDQFSIKAQYHMTSGLTEDGDSVADTGASLLTAGIDFMAGKKTTIYAIFSMATNENAARYKCTGGGHGETIVPAAGNDPTGFGVGIIHIF